MPTELRLNRLIPILASGLVIGSLMVIIAISFTSLVYTGPLSPFVGLGIGLALGGVVINGIIISLTSSYPGSITAVQDNAVVISALMAASIAARVETVERSTFVTVVAAVMLATILVGVVMLALGTFRLGRLIRFIPYPVIGGFLAGTGWLVLLGGLGVMTGLSLNLDTLSAHFEGGLPIRWVPGVLFGVLLLVVTRRVSHPLLLPGMLAGATVIFYLSLLVTGTSIERATEMGLFLGPFPEGSLWQLPAPAELLAADWGAILTQVAGLVTIVLVSIIALLLNASGIELVVRRDVDLNRELQAAGLANVASGLIGGLVGFHALAFTVLDHRIQARSRLSGLIAAGVTLATIIVGASLLSYFPKPVLGGLLVFLGLGFLVEWIYEAAFRLPRRDYLVVALILVVIALVGYLQGVAVGTAVAIGLFVIDYSRQSAVKHIFTGETYQSKVVRAPSERQALQARGQEIFILELEGFIFFGTASTLLDMIRQRMSRPDLPRLRYVVLDFRQVSSIDSSAVLSFTRLQQLATSEGVIVVMTHLHPEIERQLRLGGIIAPDSSVYCFPELDRGIEWCENGLLAEAAVETEQQLSLAQQLQVYFDDDRKVQQLMTYLERESLDPGQYLARQGDESAGLYFIEDGLLSVQLELGGGEVMRLRTATAGAVLGEINLYLREARTASLVSEQPSTVYHLSAEALDRMAAEAPELAAAFHALMARLLALRLADTTATLQACLS